MKTRELYKIANDHEIPVISLDIPESGSMCILTEAQRCYIGMDPAVLTDEASQRVHLGHELGHCQTGSFYNRWAARDIRQKHENRADKWAIKKLIPKDDLDQAVADGCTDLYSLAEHFCVTVPFMKKAVCWYTHGNLATDLYF